MADIKLAYAASAAISITLAGKPSDVNHLAGFESAEVDNSSALYLDRWLAGKVTTGTTPTDKREIRIYVAGKLDDTNWPDVFDGIASDETVTSKEIRNAVCRLAAVMSTDATSNRAYPFGPVSVAQLFGGNLPKKFVVFVTHDTAVNLNGTGSNHALWQTGVYQTA